MSEAGRKRPRDPETPEGGESQKFNVLPPTTRVSPLLLPHPLPPAPRPRPGHLGPHPLRGLGSGSCSARLPRGGSCPKAAAGAAGAWPSEGISGVKPWGRLGRDGLGGGGVRRAWWTRAWGTWAGKAWVGVPQEGWRGGAHGSRKPESSVPIRGKGIISAGWAGSPGALALTCREG